MRITLRQLDIFCTVARAGSTVAASQALALSQSATSAAVLELERLMGMALFDRVGKMLRPNAEGRALLPRAAALVADAQAIETQSEEVGLRLAASNTTGNYVLPALLARHAAKARRIDPLRPPVASHVRVVNTAEVARAVARLECDVGFIEGPCHEPQLDVLPWIEDELLLVAARDHALARAAPAAEDRSVRVGKAALRQAAWLMREPGSGTRESVEHALAPHLGVVRASVEFGSPEAIKRAAAAGLGIACLSRWTVQDLVSRGTLVVLKPPWPTMRRPFSIVLHNRQRSPAVKRFVEFCSTDAGLNKIGS